MSYADDDWAVFWCSLLAPILLEEVEPGERNRFLQNLSQQEVTLPNGRRKRISLSTLRRKVRRFRQHKIAGLRRKQRGDRGRPRKRRQAMLQRAVELKKEQPRRSPHVINEFLKQEAWAMKRFAVAGRATTATRCGSATFRKARVSFMPTR